MICVKLNQMLKTKLINQYLPTCIFNASGPLCTTLEELTTLDESDYTAITLSKSCTLELREGNPLPRYYENNDLTINSTGLANQGYLYYGEISERLNKKPMMVSVAGLSQVDNLTMIDYFNQIETVNAIELNLSCPNVVGKPQTGYDLEASENLLRKVFDLSSTNPQKTPIGLKMPPYFDQVQITSMADLLSNFPVSFITCINSLGNGLVINPETESVTIKPKHGLGGIGGSVVKPFALSNVFQFRQHLSSTIDIIGCGGISTGTDAFEHILVGATAVQIGSTYMREGIDCFQRITNQLTDLMKQKGYTSLNDFRGSIKSL